MILVVRTVNNQYHSIMRVRSDSDSTLHRKQLIMSNATQRNDKVTIWVKYLNGIPHIVPKVENDVDENSCSSVSKGKIGVTMKKEPTPKIGPYNYAWREVIGKCIDLQVDPQQNVIGRNFKKHKNKRRTDLSTEHSINVILRCMKEIPILTLKREG